jgi:nucleotide-binding universal stress UspA family protein
VIVLDVLAYCSEVNVWTPGVRYAAELAANLGATLTGVHVSPPWPMHEPAGTPPSLMAELIAHAQEEIGAAMHAGTRFGTWARDLGVAPTRWHVALGDPADALGVAGNWNDIIVIDRRIGDRDDTVDLIRDVLLAGSVCIAVPDNGYAITRFDRIAVAFDGSPPSIRALHAATPLLRRASHVIVMEAFAEEDESDDAAKPSFDPLSYLAHRGIECEIETIACHGGSRAEAILEATSKTRADLLVSGARGKRRLGDSRLDETSRHFLDYAGVPVLMAH